MEAIPAVTAGQLTADAAPTDGAQSLGKDTFLKLLVAQLRYQDPLAPADSQQFLAQSAQFTSLEKLEDIANSMSSISRNGDLATIGNLVGKTVQHRDALGAIVESKVTAGKLDDGVVLVVDGAEVDIEDVIAVLADSAVSN